MKQVSKEGRLLDSATPSPKESPNHCVGGQNQVPEIVGVLQSSQNVFLEGGGLKNLPHMVQGIYMY